MDPITHFIGHASLVFMVPVLAWGVWNIIQLRRRIDELDGKLAAMKRELEATNLNICLR